MSEMKALMKAIEAMVADRLAVTEMELNDEFVFTENMQEVANIKAACIKLEAAGKLIMMMDNLGGVVVVSNAIYNSH